MLTVQIVQCYFAGEDITENCSVKNSINVKRGTMLFSLERAELKITQSKVPLRIKDTQGTLLLSHERRKLKIVQSKVYIVNSHCIQCYFPKREEN